MLFTRYLEQGGERGLIPVNRGPDLVCHLFNQYSMPLQSWMNMAGDVADGIRWNGRREHGRKRTCWLIKRIAMSFRSVKS